MSRVQINGLILIFVLGALIGLNSFATSGADESAVVDMEPLIPTTLGSWSGETLPPPDVWKEQLPAAHFMVRFYKSQGSIVELLVIQSADPGSFHSPMFCLPGSGWTPKEAGTKRLTNGDVSQAEFVQDFDSLVVRYWYLAGERLTAGLWHHKWNMLVNKISGKAGPNFSFRVTVRKAGSRMASDAADEFADKVLEQLKKNLETSQKAALLY